jgi:hemerythrin-like metal-binding protein
MLDANTDSLADITTESLSAMHDYARSHFHFEEKYMEQLGYPHLIEHRRLHRDFENQVYNYIRQIEAGTLILNTSLLKVIKNWLLEHILSEDKKYSIFAHDAIVPGT